MFALPFFLAVFFSLSSSALSAQSGHMRLIKTFKDPAGDERAFCISANRQALLLLNSDGIIEVSTPKGQPLCKIRPQGNGEFALACFAPNSEKILSITDEGKLQLWNSQGDLLQTREFSNSLSSLVAHPYLPLLACSDVRGYIHCLNAETWEVLAKVQHRACNSEEEEEGDEDLSLDLQFSGDGHYLSSGNEYCIRLWELPKVESPTAAKASTDLDSFNVRGDQDADETGPVIEVISPRSLKNSRQGKTRTLSLGQLNPEMEFVLRVFDPAGVKRLSCGEEEAEAQGEDLYLLHLRLEPGENKLRFEAEDELGNLSYLDFEVEYREVEPRYQGAENLSFGRSFALIYAVSEHDNAAYNLDKPVEDARQLAQVLQTRYDFGEEQIILVENPANREAFLDPLEDLGKRLRQEDQVLIFYAGHGIWDTDKEKGYWVPASGDKSRKSSLFKLSDLEDELRTLNCRHVLLITDACFSGALFKNRGGPLDKLAEDELQSANIRKLALKHYQKPSRKALTSGNLETVPDESHFFRALIQYLETNTLPYSWADQLFNYIEIQLARYDQQPLKGSLKGDTQGSDFIFILRQP